jgi:hypothetical protein
LVLLCVLHVDADGVEAKADLIFCEYLYPLPLVKWIEFVPQLHNLRMRFSWLTIGFQMMTQGALKTAKDVVLRGMSQLARTTQTVLAARNRARNLLAGPQILDVALSELQHVAQPLILLALEHLLAIVEDVICVLGYRSHVDDGAHASAPSMSLKVSKLDARDASLRRQCIINCAQVGLLPTGSHSIHF